MKKSTQEKIIETLKFVRELTNTTLAKDGKYDKMIAELKAIECEPDCAAQFDELVAVSNNNSDAFSLRHFKGMLGDKFECFNDGISSKHTAATCEWEYMKRCLVFEPYKEVKPELKEGEFLYVRYKDDFMVTYNNDTYSQKHDNWDNVIDYCIFKAKQ